MSDRPVFLYAAVYDEIADAEADYEAVFDLHAAGAVGTFDSAVIRKEEDGKDRVTKTEKPTQHGAWTRGIPRGDLKDLGEALDEGSAAVIVLGESRLGEQLERATKRANKLIEQEVDAEADDLRREIETAEKEGASP